MTHFLSKEEAVSVWEAMIMFSPARLCFLATRSGRC